MLGPYLDQRRREQPTVPYQFLGISERHGLIGIGMQNDGVRLHGGRRAPYLPRRAQQHEGRGPGIDIHGDGPATGTAHHNIGLALLELGLGDPDGGVEVVGGKSGIEDVVAVVPGAGRLQAARSRLPAVEEEEFHQTDRLQCECLHRILTVVSPNASGAETLCGNNSISKDSTTYFYHQSSRYPPTRVSRSGRLRITFEERISGPWTTVP